MIRIFIPIYFKKRYKIDFVKGKFATLYVCYDGDDITLSGYESVSRRHIIMTMDRTWREKFGDNITRKT